MDIPDLVSERLGGEEITAGVSIGDEDAVCLTPTRTLIYRSEGLLSDQRVEEFTHDAERLDVKEGRRKTKFILEYVEGAESFTVPTNRGEKVLELLLEGLLRVDGVIGSRESIAGVYRFTELTLIVTDGRLLKHIGSHVWDDDFEDYPFEDVTGLEFERASNATSIAITVEGRPQRVKVPNETARVVQQTIEEVLFDYYDVASLEELNGVIGDDDAAEESTTGGRSDDIGFEEGIDPLVTDTDDDVDEDELNRQLEDASAGVESARPERMDVSIDTRDSSAEAGDESGTATDSSPTAEAGEGGTTTAESTTDTAESASASADQSGAESTTTDAATSEAGNDSAGETTADVQSAVSSGTKSSSASAEGATPATESTATTADESTGTAASSEAGGGATQADESPETTATSAEPTDAETISREEFDALTDRVDQLTDAVERQNELLKRQHKAIKQLAREVRSEE